MSGTQVATSSSQLTYAIQGYNGINLTNWSVSSASVIAAGSGVEVAGAFFYYSGDDTNDATSFSAITTNATAYLQLVPSGTVGSQIVTSSWTATAPTWVEAKNGWYASAASATRYVAGCVKTGTTSYELKFIITPRANIRHEQAESFTNLTATTMTVTGTFTAASVVTGTMTASSVVTTTITAASIIGTAASISGAITAGSAIITGTASVAGVLTASGGISENSVVLKRKVINIGDWNMDSTTNISVAHGLTLSNIYSVNVTIISDDSAGKFMVPGFSALNSTSNTDVALNGVTSTNINLTRRAGGFFDNTDYDSTSFNRGHIVIEYLG
jgi:hypothetical protein